MISSLPQRPPVETPGGIFLDAMLSITTTGSIAAAIAAVRDVPSRVLPIATATALTRTAKAGQAAIVADMPRVFDRPSRYTLNATRLISATPQSLVATVAVKNQAGSGTRPESYLLPEVDGGVRNEKGMERALRYSGLLSRGQYVVPGQSATLDGSGNVSAATVRQVLSALRNLKAVSNSYDRRTGKRLRAGRTLRNELFVGTPSVGSGAGRRLRAGAQAGIYRREGGRLDGQRRLRLLFVITNKRPDYNRRLDFNGVVAQVARERFAIEFERAVADYTNLRP